MSMNTPDPQGSGQSGMTRRHVLRTLGGGSVLLLGGGGLASLLAACGSNGNSSGGTGGSTAVTSGGSGTGASGPDSSGASGVQPSTGSGTLTIGLFAEPDSLDPATMRLIPSYQVVTSIYDQLLWKFTDAGANDFIPGLATSYSVSSDGKSYTFKLRDGVTFHDGTPFDANAVKFSLDRLVDPKTQSISAKAVLGPYVSSTVVDPHTVTVTFSAPNGGFLDNVASPLLAIVSPTAAQKYGADFGHHPVGSGPFAFDSWSAGQSVNLKRNDTYTWGPDHSGLAGPAKLASVTYRVVSTSAAQANALQTGALQMGQGMDITDVVRLTKSHFAKNVVPASGMPFGFMLNVTKAPTDDPLVRQAIQYATDVKTINSSVFSDVYPPANTVLTKVTFGHDDTPAYAYDPTKAASLLDQAGWTVGSGGIRQKNGQQLELSWLLSTGFGFQDAAVLMSSQLQKVGIKSTIKQEVPPTISADIQKGVMNVSSIYDYAADPYIINTLFACAQVGKGPNYSHFCSPSVDSAVAAANATTDPAARAKAYQKIEAGLMQDAMFVPIYDLSAVFVTAQSVSGVAFTPLAIPVLTNASV
jgi:peptide/nickel transport system substrate-binding protein